MSKVLPQIYREFDLVLDEKSKYRHRECLVREAIFRHVCEDQIRAGQMWAFLREQKAKGRYDGTLMDRSELS